MATSAAAGLEALHETRRTRVWTARHCGAAVQAGLDQRFLSIELHLLLAIAADSGRALHYESLYEHAEGRVGESQPNRADSTRPYGGLCVERGSWVSAQALAA